MTATPLPPAKGYTDTGEVRCRCGRMVPVHVCVKHLYTPPEVHQARADLVAENQRLREALHRIDSVAVFLPTFDVLHEGGIEAVTQNIVKAISKAVAALENKHA